MARGCGAGGFRVDDPAKLDDTLAAAFAHPGPAVVDAAVDPNEPILPGHVTLKQAATFLTALARGTKDGWQIMKTVVTDQVRQLW